MIVWVALSDVSGSLWEKRSALAADLVSAANQEVVIRRNGEVHRLWDRSLKKDAIKNLNSINKGAKIMWAAFFRQLSYMTFGLVAFCLLPPAQLGANH